MANTLRKPLLVLLALVAVLALVMLAVPVLLADAQSVVYVDASLAFEQQSLVGEAYEVLPTVWVSTDGDSWRIATDEDIEVQLQYVDEGDAVSAVAPTAVGRYTARLVVTSTKGHSYTDYTTRLAVDGGSVLTTISYRVADVNVNVIVGPGTDLSYTGANRYSAIAAGTRVYNAGVAVDSAQYTIAVRRVGALADTTDVTEVGDYRVTVSYLGTDYTATFSVVQTAADAIRLANTTIFAGMYTVDGYEAQRDAYYGLSFAGPLSQDGDLDPTYVYALYMQDDKVLDAPPTAAGNYVCRVVLRADHALGLRAGDYIDLPYTIRSVPYLPIYTPDDGTELLGTGYTAHCYRYNSPFNVNVNFVLTADNGRDVYMPVASRQCYRYDYALASWQAVANVAGVGYYKCVYTIDYGAGITGSNNFGVDNADFVVNASNCTFDYYFEVIGPYAVSGIKRSYNALADATSETSVTKLNPQIKYDGVLASSSVSFKYYTEDGTEVSLDTIKTQRTAGQYVGIATFKNWTVADKLVAQAGDVYRFEFAITVPRYTGHDARTITTVEDAVASVNAVYSDYGITEGMVAYTFYRINNDICYQLDPATVMDPNATQFGASQGLYRIDAAVTGGQYDGSVFSVAFVKASAGRKNDITVDLVGLTGTSATYTGNWFVATLDAEAASHVSDYTLYYQKKNVNDGGTVTWTICDYPWMVGDYRVVMRFDSANLYYDAAYGDFVYFPYSITPQSLGAMVSISGDNVFDGTAKTVQYTFYIDQRPVTAAEVYRRTGNSDADAIKLYYANNASSSTLYKVHADDNRLLHAGSYGVALLLRKGDFSCFGRVKVAPEDEQDTVQVRNTEYSYFLRAGSVSIAKLQLDVEVTIPVGYKAMYPESGTSIVPTYLYYKGNGSMPIDITTYVSDNAIVDYVLKYQRPDENMATTVAKAVDAGNYTHQLAITDDNSVGKDGSGVDFTKDVVFGLVTQKYRGAQAGEEYDVDAKVDPLSNGMRMTVGYQITPLPLNVSYATLSTALQQAGDYYQAYFGEVFKIALSDISFSTVNSETGAVKPVDYAFDVSLVIKNRWTGTSTTTGLVYDSSLGDNALVDSTAFVTMSDRMAFVARSYTLSVVFGAPRDDDERTLYSRYHLTNGNNLTELGTLQQGSRFDVMFDVLAADANPMRVVFDPLFESYTFNGYPKNFDIRFMVGTSDVTDQFDPADYTIAYYRRDNSSYTSCRADEVVGIEGSTVQYRVMVTFNSVQFHYAIRQYDNEGTYSADGMPYIPKNATVKFEFAVVKSGVLAWGWSQGGAYKGADGLADGLTYYYNGQTTPLSVRFVSANVYADSATPINMDRGSDYDVWFYRAVDGGWAKMASAPSQPGTYVAELVFMQDIADYRVWNGVDYSYAFSYLHAEQVSGYGRSLMNHTDMYEALKSENRFVTLTIAKPTIVLDGLSAQDKVFDGTDVATIARINTSAYTVSGQVTPDSHAAVLWQLLQRPIVGVFAQAAVGNNIAVTYCLQVGDQLVPLPHDRALLDGGSGLHANGVQYMMDQLAAVRAAALAIGSLSPEEDAAFAQINSQLQQLAAYYDFYLEDVVASIRRATVKVLADDYTRTYNPDFDDKGKLTYSLSMADLTFLRSLSIEGLDANAADTDYFVGSLVRQDAANAAISSVGYPIVLGADFAFVGNALRLTDHTMSAGVISSTLAANIDITVNDARYYIQPCTITVSAALSVTDSHNNVSYKAIARQYNESDPAITYYVDKGSLLFMDELVYVDNEGVSGNGANLYYQRTHSDKPFDDVGVYDVLYDHVRIYRYGQDVTDNYIIESIPKTFEITPLELIIKPLYEDTYYINDTPTPTQIDVYIWQTSIDKYGMENSKPVFFGDLAKVYHAAAQATFRREEVATDDASVYKCYNVLLGTTRIVTEDGTDITRNFTFSLHEGTQQLVISKYDVKLEVSVTGVSKKFGEADPAVALTFHNDRNPYDFTIAETSAPSREEGEDVGTYNYIDTNRGTITIFDADGVDVTRYCNITVYLGSQRLDPDKSVLQLTIEALPVTVTVRSETVYKTGKTIIPSIIFVADNGAVISSSITSKIKSRFVVDDVMSQLNNEKESDEIRLKPRMEEGSPYDDNFIFSYAEGVLTVIYPWNVLSVEVVPTESSVAQANRFAFVGGVLYKTLQLYAVSTMDGGHQTRTMSIDLPVTDALIEEDIYLVSVHYDGSYVLCDADYADGNIVVSDNQFTYVLAVQPMYWPYYVLALFVVLVVVAVVAIVLRNKKRVKVRGKKPKKEKAKRARPVKHHSAVAPAEEAAVEEAAVDGDVAAEGAVDEDTIEADTVAHVAAVEADAAAPIAPGEEAAPARRGKKKKGKRRDDAVPGVAPVAPGGAASALPVASAAGDTLAPIPGDDDTLPTPPADGGADDGSGDVPPLPDDDDDEIVINTVSRRVSDDED